MGVREFDAWVKVTADSQRQQSSPDRWDRDDEWFDDARRTG